MAREAFVLKNFGGEALSVIAQANAIIAEYQRQGFVLTLRQLYYQFVARGYIPNTVQSYKRLGSIVNDGRLSGRIDWEAIEDRTRGIERLSTWTGAHDIVSACAHQYRSDLWKDQPYYVEVWVEKEALAGVFEQVCNRLRVPYLACRGYASQSELYRAAKRFDAAHDDGRSTVVLHFGDHDPSGIDMTRDNRERLELLSRASVDVRRLALNMEQVEEYNPPPNPAKTTDSRASGYIREFGYESWELDALEPATLSALVESAVEDIIDRDAWERDAAEESQERAALDDAARFWSAKVLPALGR